MSKLPLKIVGIIVLSTLLLFFAMVWYFVTQLQKEANRKRTAPAREARHATKPDAEESAQKEDEQKVNVI